MSQRLRHLTDLYTVGDVAVLRDGSTVWMQVLNPFEADDARNEATIAKARLTLALKEHSGDEQAKVKMFFLEDGLAEAIEKLVDAKVASRMGNVLEEIRNDPEWTERMSILDRGLDDTAKPVEPAEREAFERVSVEYATEVGQRLARERDFWEDDFGHATEEQLWESYLEWYIERRSNEVATAEYRLHQLYYGARLCVAERIDGHWDHGRCDHSVRLFPSKTDARSVPEELSQELFGVLDRIEMTVRDAKNSDRQGSSSDSSPLPSEPAESTPSIQDVTHGALPGTSASPSLTPSPSLASTS